jgi:hypothetical protein
MPNQTLRRGLFGVVRYGVRPGAFNTFVVGDSGLAVRPSNYGIYGYLGEQNGSYLMNLEEHQWGFEAYFEPGNATGTWAEIAMAHPGGLGQLGERFYLNRSLIVKGANTRIRVSITFSLYRG